MSSTNSRNGGNKPVTANPYAKRKNPPHPLPPRSSSSSATGSSSFTKKSKPSAPIRNPYAPSRTSGTTAAASRSMPNNSGNSNSNGNSTSRDNYDGGLSQVQPMTFTQAFGNEDDDFEQSNISTRGGQDGSNSTSTGARATAAAHTARQNSDNIGNDDAIDSDKRVGHRMIAKHVLGVSTRQKGNPVLHHIRNVPFDYYDMVPDYIMSATSCALFLSLKYHRLFPDYIHRRLGELRTDFKLRVLLVLVDVSDNADLILKLNRIGVVNNLTVVLAWSEAEAGRYLETYKALDGKDASSIQKRESSHIVDQMQDFWTACKPVNKTDAASLWEHFGNLKTVVKASRDEWALVSGLGPVKIQRLYEALHKPFSSRAARKRKHKREEVENIKNLVQEKEDIDNDINEEGKIVPEEDNSNEV